MNGKTSIVGLLGEHIENSLSPFIHQKYIRYYSLNYCYLPFQVKASLLKSAIIGIKVLGIRGVNVTIPFKEKLNKFIDFIDSSAKEIGAINTIVQKDGKLYGYNTDWTGFRISLVKRIMNDKKNKKAIVLGAGGAAKAVIYALGKEKFSSISIFNRNQQHALEIKERFRRVFPRCIINSFLRYDKNLQEKINQSDIIVNTTPLGSWYFPEQNSLPEDIKLPSRVIVYDLIYYPHRTPLLKMAEENGNVILNGKPMLVYQAAESFYFWTGIQPDGKILNQILEEI